MINIHENRKRNNKVSFSVLLCLARLQSKARNGFYPAGSVQNETKRESYQSNILLGATKMKTKFSHRWGHRKERVLLCLQFLLRSFSQKSSRRCFAQHFSRADAIVSIQFQFKKQNDDEGDMREAFFLLFSWVGLRFASNSTSNTILTTLKLRLPPHFVLAWGKLNLCLEIFNSCFPWAKFHPT